MGDVTQLLLAWRGGDKSALERLMPLVYDDLRKRARHYVRHERNGSLQSGDLVNEAYLKLVESNRVQWRDRAHFFALVSTLMRRVLIDQARKRDSQKRGGAAVRVSLSDLGPDVANRDSGVDVVALHEAMQRMARVWPRKCQIVEMRVFGGLTIEEIAAVLDVSTDTVKREWRVARHWLEEELSAARPHV